MTDTYDCLGDGGDAIRVLSGDCTVIYDSPDERQEYRGHITAITKPDEAEKLLVDFQTTTPTELFTR